MNPALLLVILFCGTAMLAGGVMAAVFGWLPMEQAVVLAIVGFAIETVAGVVFALSRRPRKDASAGRPAGRR